MAGGKKLYLAHNVDVMRPDDREGVPKGAQKVVRHQAGRLVSAGEFTKDEIESLKLNGAVREPTSDEEGQAAEMDRADEQRQLQAEHDTERQQLAREHAAQRSVIEKKHDQAKAKELATLEEKHATERENLDKQLAKKIAAGNKAAEK